MAMLQYTCNKVAVIACDDKWPHIQFTPCLHFWFCSWQLPWRNREPRVLCTWGNRSRSFAGRWSSSWRSTGRRTSSCFYNTNETALGSNRRCVHTWDRWIHHITLHQHLILILQYQTSSCCVFFVSSSLVALSFGPLSFTWFATVWERNQNRWQGEKSARARAALATETERVLRWPIFIMFPFFLCLVSLALPLPLWWLHLSACPHVCFLCPLFLDFVHLRNLRPGLSTLFLCVIFLWLFSVLVCVSCCVFHVRGCESFLYMPSASVQPPWRLQMTDKHTCMQLRVTLWLVYVCAEGIKRKERQRL